MPIPPYVAALREHVGHAMLWLPGVVTAVVLDGDRLLLTQRADTGAWALPSGILDPGEQPAVGIAREIAEETGVAVVVDALTGVGVTEPISYPNGDVSQYLDLRFACHPVDEAAAASAHVADDESLAVAWVALDALPPLAASSQERLAAALAFLRAPGAGPAFVRA